jgi:hypothetical protein
MLGQELVGLRRGEREINFKAKRNAEGGEEAVRQAADFGRMEESMTKMGAVIRFLVAVGSSILTGVLRVAKRWAAPGAGPKVISA